MAILLSDNSHNYTWSETHGVKNNSFLPTHEKKFKFPSLQNASKKFFELIRYFIVGLSTVLIDFFIYKFLSNFLIIEISKTLSFLTGSLWSYQLNRLWTFKNIKPKLSQFIKYLVIHISSLFLNVLVNSLLIKILPTNFLWRLNLAFTFATLASAIYNFLFIKFLIFNKYN